MYAFASAMLAAFILVAAFILLVLGFVGLIMLLWKPNPNPEPLEHTSLEFDALWIPDRNRKEDQ